MSLGLKKDYYGTVIIGYIAILVNMIVQVVLIPLYISGMGEYNYGVYLLLYSFINYVDIGIGLFSGGILRLIGECHANGNVEGIRNSYSLSKYVICAYGIISAFLLLGYGMLVKGFGYFSNERSEAVKIIFSAMLFLIVKYDLSVEYQVLSGTQRQALSNGLQIIAQLIYLTLAVPYLIKGNGAVSNIFFYNTAGLICVRAIIFILHRKFKDHVMLIRPNKGMSEIRARLIGKMGFRYAVYGILIITFQADTLILGTIESNAALITQYAMTWKVAEAARQVLWKIPESMQPYIIEQDATGNYKSMREQYKKIYGITAVLSIAALLCYGIFGKLLISSWLGDSYVEISNGRIWLTAAVILLNGVERTPAIYAYSTVHLKELNKIAGIETVAKTVLTIVLYSKLGLMAPLAAMIAVHICGIGFAYWKLGERVTDESIFLSEKNA